MGHDWLAMGIGYPGPSHILPTSPLQRTRELLCTTQQLILFPLQLVPPVLHPTRFACCCSRIKPAIASIHFVSALTRQRVLLTTKGAGRLGSSLALALVACWRNQRTFIRLHFRRQDCLEGGPHVKNMYLCVVDWSCLRWSPHAAVGSVKRYQSLFVVFSVSPCITYVVDLVCGLHLPALPAPLKLALTISISLLWADPNQPPAPPRSSICEETSQKNFLEEFGDSQTVFGTSKKVLASTYIINGDPSPQSRNPPRYPRRTFRGLKSSATTGFTLILRRFHQLRIDAVSFLE